MKLPKTFRKDNLEKKIKQLKKEPKKYQKPWTKLPTEDLKEMARDIALRKAEEKYTKFKRIKRYSYLFNDVERNLTIKFRYTVPLDWNDDIYMTEKLQIIYEKENVLEATDKVIEMCYGGEWEEEITEIWMNLPWKPHDIPNNPNLRALRENGKDEIA